MADLNPKTPVPTPVDKHRANVGAGNYNRFSALFPRNRTPSTKRARTSGSEENEQGKIPKLDAEVVFNQLKEHDKCMDNARAALTGAATAIGLACKTDDNGIGTALSKLHGAIEQLISGSEMIKSAMVDMCKVQGEKSQSRAATSLTQSTSNQVGIGNPRGPLPSTADTLKEKKEEKVKRVLRDAERKMVVFDLDLGSAPTINKDSISRKVTMALHGKAQSGEHDWNTADASEMVDDVLSCSTLEFLGSGTRKFNNTRNPSDHRNNKMCTVPVRFDFKNKETRVQAEQTFRKVCKLRPSVPYPKRLRAMINEAVRKGKESHKDSFIMTKVDIDKLILKAMVRKDNRWVELSDICQAIPTDILDRTSTADLETDMEVFTQAASEVSQASL